MKRLLAALLLCCMLLPCVAMAQTPESTPEIFIFDMEDGITLGMTRDEVLALEGTPTNDYGDTIAYQVDGLYGEDGNINYRFTEENHLEAIIIYFSDEKHAKAVDYIHDFSTVDEQLVAQLGEPTLLRDYAFQIDPPEITVESLGNALTSGQLEITTSWLTDEISYAHIIYKEATTIMHMLTINAPAPAAE